LGEDFALGGEAHLDQGCIETLVVGKALALHREIAGAKALDRFEIGRQRARGRQEQMDRDGIELRLALRQRGV
jgi:hypothetical protein